MGHFYMFLCHNVFMKCGRLVAFLVCNLFIILLELVGLYLVFESIGIVALIYYTQLSNIFLLAAAVINAYSAIKALNNRKKCEISPVVWRILHAATSVTTVTFLVVVFVLSWMYGSLWYVLTAGSMLYTHTLCPLIALGTFIAFTPKCFIYADALKATYFTLIYGLIAIVLNVMHVLEGPYPFLYVYRQPLWATIAWVIGIFGGAYAIARLLLISKIKNKYPSV